MPGPGGRETVAARPRMAPIYSLLTAATIDPDDPADHPAAATDGPLAGMAFGGRWLNGIRYRREPCGVADALYSGCDEGDVLEDMLSFDPDSVEVDTDPFRVIVGETCSAFGWPANDYVGRAQRFLAASEAYTVEKEFWTGTQAQAAILAGIGYPDDQWLAQAISAVDVTPVPGTSVKLGKGLALLQQALGDCTGGGPGMIHMPPILLNPLVTLMVVTPLPPTGSTPAQIVDLRGNRIVPGFGYSDNLGPTGAAPAAGKAWMYATGPVYIKRGDPVVVPNTYAQAINKVTNDITFHVERDYLVDWDRCCHFAVLVDDDVAGD